MALEHLLDHAIGRHHDQYLQQLAMTVVQLQSVREIASQQADLFKHQAEAQRRAEKMAEDRALITQTKRKLTLGQKQLDKDREELEQREQAVEVAQQKLLRLKARR